MRIPWIDNVNLHVNVLLWILTKLYIINKWILKRNVSLFLCYHTMLEENTIWHINWLSGVRYVVALCSFHTISNKGDTRCMSLKKEKKERKEEKLLLWNLTFMHCHAQNHGNINCIGLPCIVFVWLMNVRKCERHVWHDMEETDYLQAHLSCCNTFMPTCHIWQNSH